MVTKETKSRFFNIKTLAIAGSLLILLAAVLLLWHSNLTSNQALPALMADVYFDGEYRIADGEWQKIVEGQHIPATKGDVTLRGNFHMLAPDGEYVGICDADMPIAFYTDHINLTFFEADNEPYVMDTENPLLGDSACGVSWFAHSFTGESEQPIEILIHNPHRYGNETAIDEMLSNVSIWSDFEFEKELLARGESQRNTGLFFIIVSLVLFGLALFSTLIHIKNSGRLWLFGMVIMFAGTYFAYSASGVVFWSDSTVSNTIILGGSMIFYMLFLSMGIVYFLNADKKLGVIATLCLGVVDALCFVLPTVTDLIFYDMWFYWTIAQMIVNVILSVCLIRECFCQREKHWLYVAALFPLIAFGVDAAMTGLGVWQGGVVSKCVFVGMFAVTMVVVLRIIPRNINAAEKAKEL